MVFVVRNHVLSAHCEATAWKEKLHATLLIICVYNITKHYFVFSGSGKLYAKQTSIFIMFHSNWLQKENKKTSSTNARGKHLNTGFISRSYC